MKKNISHNVIPNNESGRVKMNDHLETIKVCYKDDYDEPLFCKSYKMTSSLSEIINGSPTGVSNYLINLDFNNIKRLWRLELISMPRKEQRLVISMNVDELMPKTKSEKKWQEAADRLCAEIWKHDEKIMHILSANELSVNWGGPDVKAVKALANVEYYVDNGLSSVAFIRTYKKPEKIPDSTLKELYKKTCELSKILDLIVNSCKK